MLKLYIDAGDPFVKATYRLEGDGPLIFSAYEEINALTASISTQFYPNTIAVARKQSSNPVQQQQLIDYSKSCVQPAYSYFNVTFGHDLKQTVEAFKYARFFDPAKITGLKPFCNDNDQLKVFPFFNSDDKLDELKAELPTYLAKADGVSTEMDKLDWWRKHENELPLWSKVCKTVLLVQPSSAAAERVFSLLSNSFTETQTSSTLNPQLCCNTMAGNECIFLVNVTI